MKVKRRLQEALDIDVFYLVSLIFHLNRDRSLRQNTWSSPMLLCHRYSSARNGIWTIAPQGWISGLHRSCPRIIFSGDVDSRFSCPTWESSWVGDDTARSSRRLPTGFFVASTAEACHWDIWIWLAASVPISAPVVVLDRTWAIVWVAALYFRICLGRSPS